MTSNRCPGRLKSSPLIKTRSKWADEAQEDLVTPGSVICRRTCADELIIRASKGVDLGKKGLVPLVNSGFFGNRAQNDRPSRTSVLLA
jgi:hypothetical protein